MNPACAGTENADPVASETICAMASSKSARSMRRSDLASNTPSWPHRGELEKIMSSDLSARAGLYADAATANNPPFGAGTRGCAYCHAERRS